MKGGWWLEVGNCWGIRVSSLLDADAGIRLACLTGDIGAIVIEIVRGRIICIRYRLNRFEGRRGFFYV